MKSRRENLDILIYFLTKANLSIIAIYRKDKFSKINVGNYEQTF